MAKNIRKMLWEVLALVNLASTPIFGATFTFNFNSLMGYSNTAGDQGTSIAAQLTAQLQTVCPGCYVTIPTTTASNGNQMGAIIDKSYTGDRNVVGPTSGSHVISETLGDTPSSAVITSNSQYTYSQLHTERFTNQFLATTNDSSHGLSNQTGIEDQITIQFHGLSVTGASFNFEIFPDGSSQQPPDFTLEAGNDTTGVDTVVNPFPQSGVLPCGTAGNCGSPKQTSSGTDGSNIHSPASTTSNTEKNAQYIGNWSGTFSSSTELDFVDWPATIGIDHFTITFSPVPEPGSLILFGTVLAWLVLKLRDRTQA